MAGPSAVLIDDSKLSKFDQLFFKLERQLNLLGGIVIFLIVVLTVTNVLGRWIFDSPVTGYIDWIEQTMAFFAFLGIAYCQRQGAHIRMDIFIGAIHGRLKWFAELISVILMLAITLILIYGSSLHAWRAFDLGDSSMDIGLPTWPAKLIVPVALSFLAIRLLLQVWAYFRAFKNRSDSPIAVPLNEDVAVQTLLEAEALSNQKQHK